MFVYIQGKPMYEEPLENPKAQVVNNTQEIVMELCVTNMHAVGTSMLHNEQNQDKMCKQFASQIHSSNRNSFKSVTMSASGILQNTNMFMVCSKTEL